MISTRAEQAKPEEARGLDTLTRLERQWLRRRFCGWCDISCLATRCGARFDMGTPCNMDRQRAVWLQSYKPRAGQ